MGYSESTLCNMDNVQSTNEMFCTTSEAEGEVVISLNLIKPLVIFCITDRSSAVHLIWLSVYACFWCQFL